MTINLKSQISNLKSKLQGGFTLIELMVVLGVTAVLGTLGIAGFTTYNQIQVLQSSASEVITMLNLAKSRSQSQIKPSGIRCATLDGYTVNIVKVGSAWNYTLTIRCSGADVVPPLVTKTLPANLNFTANASFFFPIMSGGASEAGYITLAGYGKEKNIVVSPFGGISMQLLPTVFPTSTPTPAPFPTSTPIPTSTPTPLLPTPTLVPPTSTPTPTLTPKIYSEFFRSGSTSTAQCTVWNTWRASLTGTYSKVTLKGSNDPVGVSCTGSSANTICQSLRTGSPLGVSCGGRSWVISGIGSCGDGVELNANGSICQCNVGYTVRPCIGNANWGAINGEACGANDQTMTVVCQP